MMMSNAVVLLPSCI